MTKMIKMTLLAATLAVSAPFAMAADNRGGMDNGSRSDHMGAFDNNEQGPSLEEREELLDRNSTGSIQACDTGTYDANGNCVYMAPQMQ